MFSTLDEKLMRCTCPGLADPGEIEETVDTVGHAWNCTSVNCPYDFCKRMKKRIAKTRECMHNMYDAMDCEICKDMVYFLNLHSDECVEVECEVFGCKNNKKDEVGRMMVKVMMGKIQLEFNTRPVILTGCSICADDSKTVQSSHSQKKGMQGDG
ncbi:histone acetyltransferase HAC12-like [Carex rostrata]